MPSKKLETKPKTKDVRIVVGQRGWVMVGYYQLKNGRVFLTNAQVIRRWGTIKGLGEITSNGPTQNTILDPCNGTVEFNELTTILTIKCEATAWEKHLL